MKEELIEELANTLRREIPFIVESDVYASEMSQEELTAIAQKLLPIIARERQAAFAAADAACAIPTEDWPTNDFARGMVVQAQLTQQEIRRLAELSVTSTITLDRAVVEQVREALEWIAANYENGHLNHVDFRVEAKHLSDAALAKLTEAMR